jgi:hypothetical protein
MKKTLISALTTAIVVGAASTTFAAANPFSDVPADSWAYDAVAQLAKDGVVDGYGDGTYRGEQNMTRYEMAQIIARAMAKQDVSAADKAMIDKLAAEFSDELSNLGVRVSNLEKKVDNVKWTGEARYRWDANHVKDDLGGGRSNDNQVLFRLEPSAQVNEHWTAKARIDYYTDGSKADNINTNKDSNNNNNSIQVDRMYAQGVYGSTTINLGKLPFKTADGGMILDDRITGAQVIFGKNVKVAVTAGRFDTDNQSPGFGLMTNSASTYASIQVNDNSKKFTWLAGYHYLKNKDFNNASISNYNADTAGIWEVGVGYNFTPTFNVNANYAKNSKGSFDTKYRQAYSIEANYKGADQTKRGSFGLTAAYRNLGAFAVLDPTYDAAKIGALNPAGGVKGWEFIGQYTFDKNILGTVKYFKGKTIADDSVDASRVFGQLEFFF